MGTTLDQLLEATGIGELSGKGIKKTASEEPAAFSKLAERCRRAATASPEEEARGKTNELVEKTAAVAVIARTLSEIEDIVNDGGDKTASAVDDPRIAEFINASLNEGHQPEAIAEFLVKEGGRIRRFFGGIRAGFQRGKGEILADMGTKSLQSSKRGYEAMVRDVAGGSDAAKSALINKLRRTMPDEDVAKVMEGAGVKGFDHLPEMKSLKPMMGPPVKPLASVNIGGKEHSLTGEQAKKIVTHPATMIGAGLVGGKMMFGGDSEGKKKSGKNVFVVG
jgi:hypothetical protein